VYGNFRVGPWLVEPSLNSISRNGTTLHLERKQMEVLVCLAEHPGEPLSKEKLLQSVWHDTFVSDDVLTRSIFELRRVFADNARESRFIQTIPKRGYRLVAPVVSVNDASGDNVAAPSAGEPAYSGVRWGGRASRLGALALGVVVLLCSVLLVLNPWDLRNRILSNQDDTPIRSLAVLPLKNLSNDPEQQYFAQGMTEELITDLSQISALKVVSRTSSETYENAGKSLPEIARELNVDGIIEGTVQRAGDRVRITAQLIYGPSDKHLWANSYERDMRDVFALERDVTEDIAHHIQARLTTQNRAEQAQPRPMDPRALEAYLQGNYHLNQQGKGFGDEEKKKAAEYFRQAIAADPNFAPAYHGLALSHENLWLGSSGDVAIARRAGEKALEVDPNYAAGRVNLVALKWVPDLDWRGAEEGLRRARVLDPNNPFAHSALCILLVTLGQVDEGLQECRIAQRLDPFDDDSALGLYLGRDYDGSIAMLRAMLQGDPEVGLWHCDLFSDYAMKRMYEEATKELGQCYSLYGHPEAAANIQRAFESSGYRGAIGAWAKEIEHLQATHQAFLPGSLAQAYAILGDKDRAFYWLEQAYERREMVSFDGGVFQLRAEPMYDPLRSDPRFKELLRRVGLPE
jgi:TolB-like protein/DNA-binding winged helix-turn-helix (wHTH) protein/Flp pilus assembly protein TadD